MIRDSAKLFIIDEPLNNLDYDNMINVSNLINKIHREHPNAAFLLVTHCRIFPFITKRIDLNNGRILSISPEKEGYLEYYHCLKEPVNEGFYKLPD